MAETNENPESSESSVSGNEAEQKVNAEQPVSAEPAASPEQPAGAEQPVSTEQAASVQEEQVSKEVNKDARMWAMFCHLVGLAAFSTIIPIFGGAIGALIIWQIKKDDFPFVDEQGKEAVNFQISMLIYGVVALLLCFACVGFVLAPAVMIFDIVFLLIAAVKANNGFHYRYPLCIRFIK